MPLLFRDKVLMDCSKEELIDAVLDLEQVMRRLRDQVNGQMDLLFDWKASFEIEKAKKSEPPSPSAPAAGSTLKSDRAHKLRFLTLDQAKDILLRCHAILDRAEIPEAAGENCNDPECSSHLTHRLHALMDRYKEGKP